MFVCSVYKFFPHTSSEMLELIDRTRMKSVYYEYVTTLWLKQLVYIRRELSKHLNINGAKTFMSLLLLLWTVIEIRIIARDRFVLLVDTDGPMIPI